MEKILVRLHLYPVKITYQLVLVILVMLVVEIHLAMIAYPHLVIVTLEELSYQPAAILYLVTITFKHAPVVILAKIFLVMST